MWTPEQLKKSYGDEYPAAVVIKGVRIPLYLERRFTRNFHSPEHKMGTQVSRFMDGSASITASEFQHEWPNWDEDLRVDFCQASVWLHKQADFPEMLRFIASQGRSGTHWPAVAMKIASHLPQQEAFGILVDVLRHTDIGRASNITQAIAHTKHPQAEAVLRKHLAAVWEHPDLGKDDSFTNWVAFDATTCIAHLIELGAPPTDFEEQVRRLSEHVCSGNRQSCRTFLSKHYSWLK